MFTARWPGILPSLLHPPDRHGGRGTATGIALVAGVEAIARNCPAGPHLMSASLVQDGLPTLWATSGRGAGEIQCDDGTVELGMAFARRDPVLHPGRATVRFTLRDWYTGEQLAESTRTIWIPC
ncbi:MULTISPECIES: hypothetical protein [unclassified Micromonospora]|uniref:hypothetical protein n=1 Tax=unclassified Micromonospora TaxID=2617518 RepID=UPI0033A97C5F